GTVTTDPYLRVSDVDKQRTPGAVGLEPRRGQSVFVLLQPLDRGANVRGGVTPQEIPDRTLDHLASVDGWHASSFFAVVPVRDPDYPNRLTTNDRLASKPAPRTTRAPRTQERRRSPETTGLAHANRTPARPPQLPAQAASHWSVPVPRSCSSRVQPSWILSSTVSGHGLAGHHRCQSVSTASQTRSSAVRAPSVTLS